VVLDRRCQDPQQAVLADGYTVLNDGATRKHHTYAVWSLSADASGQALVSGGGDSQVCLWDLRKNSCRHSFSASKFEGEFIRVQFDVNNVFAMSAKGELSVLQWNSSNHIATSSVTREVMGNDITMMEFAVRGDSVLCISSLGVYQLSINH
jgi:WD40 repeat protein